MGDCRIEIRTSVLEEKGTACTMLCCYVEALKEGFLPYLQQTTDLMLPLVKFMFNEEVRGGCTPYAVVVRHTEWCCRMSGICPA